MKSIIYFCSTGDAVAADTIEEAPKNDAPNNAQNSDQTQGQWQTLLDTIVPTSNQTVTSTNEQFLQENNQLLRALTNYIVKGNRYYYKLNGFNELNCQAVFLTINRTYISYV